MNVVIRRAAWIRGLLFFTKVLPANLFCVAALLSFTVLIQTNAVAQTNSWTNSASGNWEDNSWSLGILPGTNQTVLLTNAGWKAVEIGSATAQNFPQTLNIGALTISSPTNSFNTLLMNYCGTQTPLVVGSSSAPGNFILSSNSAVLMISSALQVQDSYFGTPNDQAYGGFFIGGNFSESDYSTVSAGYMRIGYLGSATYNLTNSLLSTGYQYLGGWPATFNQQGGTNSPGNLEVDQNGIYNLFDGELNGTIVVGGTLNFLGGKIDGTLNLNGGGTFNQHGGTLNAQVNISGGNCIFSGGNFSGGIALPSNDQTAGSALQTGGTNSLGQLWVGYGISMGAGFGYYTMSNGVLSTSGTTVNAWGQFHQYGGSHLVSGALNVAGGMDSPYSSVCAVYTLDGGTLAASSLNASLCNFTQSGGTNQISGDVTLGPSQSASDFNLTGGALTDANVTVQPSYNGGFFQSGGTHTIANSLNVIGGIPNFSGYVLSGGTLTVSNIQITGGGIFQHTGGSLIQNGLITLANGQWDVGVNIEKIGSLQLGISGGTNSIVRMPDGPGVLNFSNSSGNTWSNQAALTIQNWSGSIYGNGGQKIIFGGSASGLTPQQLSQIRFENPAGLPAGTYPARILATGEITPGPVVNLVRLGSRLVVQWDGAATLQTATNIAGPFEDVVSVTSPYTNQFTDAQRFFRLRQ
jgi:hypothetical protein